VITGPKERKKEKNMKIQQSFVARLYFHFIAYLKKPRGFGVTRIRLSLPMTCSISALFECRSLIPISFFPIVCPPENGKVPDKQ